MKYYLVNLLHNIAGFEIQTSHPVVVLEDETLSAVVSELIEGQYIKKYDDILSCCMNNCTLITQEQFNFLKKVL